MTDDSPPDFEFRRSSRLQKARTQTTQRVTPEQGDALVVEDDAKKLAVVAAAAPADPSHGRPAGAGNALAFHAWKKDPPKSGSSE